MNIEQIKSELTMRDFYFSECSIVRDKKIKGEKLNVDLKKELTEEQDNIFQVKLILTINKPEEDMQVKVVANATFHMENDDTQLVKSIIQTNTVAIMFPFIRSQISLLTTQPGMSPIVLPPINTEKFKN